MSKDETVPPESEKDIKSPKLDIETILEVQSVSGNKNEITEENTFES